MRGEATTRRAGKGGRNEEDFSATSIIVIRQKSSSLGEESESRIARFRFLPSSSLPFRFPFISYQVVFPFVLELRGSETRRQILTKIDESKDQSSRGNRNGT